MFAKPYDVFPRVDLVVRHIPFFMILYTIISVPLKFVRTPETTANQLDSLVLMSHNVVKSQPLAIHLSTKYIRLDTLRVVRPKSSARTDKHRCEGK